MNKEKTHGVNASISGSVEFSEGAIIEQAKVTFGITVSRSVSTTDNVGATDKTPKGEYAHYQWAVWGYKIRWRKVYDYGNCKTTTLGSGVAYLPNRHNQGWHVWNSKHAN